jgi:hypothetical protein
MPDLTPAEQAIVDLVEREGPKTERELHREVVIEVERGVEWMRVPLIDQGKRDLLSRGLLLERERTVECPTCWGAGDRSDPYCKGTGSVKERVIGVACDRCGGGEWTTTGYPGDGPEPCPRCSSTPTPGLDPGDAA